MPKDKATRRAGREQFRNAAKEFGKSLLKKPDSEKRLETSSKPVVQNEMQKKYESSAHDLVKQESNVSAKDALDWEPIFPIDYELPKFKRISVKGCESANDDIPEEVQESARLLAEAMFIREKYISLSLQEHCPTTAKALNEIDEEFDVDVLLNGRELSVERKHVEPRKQKKVENYFDLIELPDACNYKFDIVDGVFRITGGTPLKPGSVFFKKDGTPKGQIAPDKTEFLEDYYIMLAACANGPLRSFSTKRLTFLEGRYNLHVLMNHKKEMVEMKEVPKRDYYNVRKVDTHIHATASMSQKDLLKFMRRKLKNFPDDIVDEVDGKKITLKEYFDNLGLKAEDLTVDSLDVHAGAETFNRFDNFNKKYNPAGQGKLRKLFLKKQNFMGGRYLAEQIKAVMKNLEDHKYVNNELRISVHGKYKDEWQRLAKWAVDYNIQSPNVRWLIQVPRLFDIYRNRGNYENFETCMKYLFGPMFAATIDPKSYPEMHKFMTQVIGFDSVDDESIPELNPFDEDSPTPPNWTDAERPPYSYYIYYMYCNIMTLNHLRRERGMNTFVLRPHCGEAGSPKHLVAGFMLCQNISHGLMLRKAPAMQYLYYLTQIAVAMSPLSNNALFLEYSKNPMPKFFARGLQVTLSTDDPLIFHYTQQPLVEEYAIAAQVYKLNGADISELSRNSVLMCGFEEEVKQQWLGKNYAKDGLISNDITKSNVPNIRASFRYETLVEELSFVCNVVKNA